MNNSLKNNIIAWEKKRIWFNALIGVVGLISSFSIIHDIGILNYLTLTALFGISMNICYCLGPILEIYLSLFTSVQIKPWRNLLFASGTILTIIFTLATAFNFAMMVKSGNYPVQHGMMP